MASKTRDITLTASENAFFLASIPFFPKQITREKEHVFDKGGIALFRQLLSNERARILYTIKHQRPKSIYDLAKKLGRTFKAVFADLKLLERFGFIELVREKTGKRQRLKPILAVEYMRVTIKI